MAKEKTNEAFEIEKFNAGSLPELISKETEIKELLKANVIIDITDTASYETMKKSRTAVKTARTGYQKEKKMVLDRLKEVVIKGVEKKYDDVIEMVTIGENARQQKVDVWEEKKAEEARERQRAEDLRVETAKNSIQLFYNVWNSLLTEMTFEQIEAKTSTLTKEIDEFDTASLQEFSVLFDRNAGLLNEKLSERTKTLTDAENNRIEQEKLAEERRENTRKQNIQDAITVFYNAWFQRIAVLTDSNFLETQKAFSEIKDADYSEFQEDYSEKKNSLSELLKERKAIIDHAKAEAVKAEALRKEQEQFAAEKLAFRTEKRIKQLTDLGFIKTPFGYEFLEDGVALYTVDGEGFIIDDDEWGDYIEYATGGIKQLDEEDEQVVFSFDIPIGNSEEEIHDQIGADPILEAEPVQIIDEEEPIVCDVDYEETALTKDKDAVFAEMLEALEEAKRMYEKVQPAGGWQGVYDQICYSIIDAKNFV